MKNSSSLGKIKKQRTIEELNENRTAAHEVFEWIDSIIIAMVVVVLLFTFVFRMVGIVGSSMENTLLNGDKVIITNFFYTPKQGDVVVISRNYNNDNSYKSLQSEPIIKRVIATEGQVVDIDFVEGVVYIDGVKLEESYIKNPTFDKYETEFPLRVSEGHVFVLGDNRAVSKDSRSSEIGLVDCRYILGKANLRIFPFNKIGGIN